MKLTSNAFTEGRRIPVAYTCDGRDVAPPLRWHGAPSGTKSFALICSDPDGAPDAWTHGIIYDLPELLGELREHVPPGEAGRGGAKPELTDFDAHGYSWPCPPPGKPQRYRFHLYALDAVLGVAPPWAKARLLQAMLGHVLGDATLQGIYER